ncbi:class V chitinase-like [Rosa rugosa]|uniref:class V chitinase-like n=1 Tax=Rosa rugosa TaxID=74645 RepID=UPI002B40EE01|nr:class V chitinase-like [Rosa rugosa]
MSSKTRTLSFLFSALLFLTHLNVSTAQTTVVKAAYWFPYSGKEVSAINSTLFTHLFCAFADLNLTTYQVTISSEVSPQFSSFTQTVQQKNPNVKTLLSIGGGNSSPSTFAAMASQATRRKAFIDSSIKLARNYSFYGLDLDWEYPSSATEMTHFGSLLTEWRSAVANESCTSGKTALLLTAAVFRNASYYRINYPFKAISSSLDWINLMTYDYYGPSFFEGKTNTYPPAALYNGGSTILVNGDSGIVTWINNARISTKKIVIGLPFYGRAWKLLNPNNHGYFAPANGSAIGADGNQLYNQIRVLISRGFQTVYNATVVGNYCYNGTTWIGYDDTQSIRAKVSYAKGKSLLGYIAWHTGADTNTWTLAQTAFSTWG